jgi:cold shock CspA family protein
MGMNMMGMGMMGMMGPMPGGFPMQPMQKGGKGAGMAGGMPGIPQDGASLSGVVKTYDATKDFGFLSCPRIPYDVYFKSEGQSVEIGTNVSFTLKWMKDGKPQARGITIGLSGGETLVGTVKTYSDKNGYGFLGVADSSQDVYFQKKDLPDEVQGIDGREMQGATMRFNVRMKPDGKPQAENIAMVTMAGQEGAINPPAGSIFPPQHGMKRPSPSSSPAWTAHGGVTPQPKMARMDGAAASPGGERLVGTIMKFNSMKGFGFIQAPGLSGDVFFKNTMLPPEWQQTPSEGLEGVQVSFDHRITPDGKHQGSNVQPAE